MYILDLRANLKRRCKDTTFSGALAGKCRTSPHNAALNYTKPNKQESLLRQFRQLNRQLLTMHEYVFHTKIRSYALATKIFKNNEDIRIGYIWCCCHTSFRHRQINVQTKAAQISIRGPRKFLIFGESGGSGRLTTPVVGLCDSLTEREAAPVLSLYLPLILRLRAAPNRFHCSSNHSPNLSPFGRTYDVLPN